MKTKNEVKNVTENIVNEPLMSEEQMQQFVDEHLNLVPRNQVGKFNELSLERKVGKIQLYIDFAKQREAARERNRIVNRVKELFEKRKASLEEVKDVAKLCEDFISTFKQRQIDEIDAEIRKLQMMKDSLND